VVLDNKVDERVQMEEIETLTTQVETIPNPSPDSKPPSPSPSSADVRPPSAIDLGSDVELATPAPVVHTHAPRRPVSVHLSPAKGPPRLFPLQSGQDQLSDAQSDDEISLD
jgi:hypothetical protein